MKKKTIERVNALDILEVAEKLGIEFSPRGKYRRCLCFMHDDHNPSMWLKVGDNTWKCPVCDKGGDNIALVMAHQQIGFVEAVEWLMAQFNIAEDYGERYKSITPTANKAQMTTTAITEAYQRNNFSLDSTFTKALAENGILTSQQVRHAAERYHLGRSKDGGVIYWMIDRDGTVCDGKVMFYRADCHRDHERHPFTVSSWMVQHKQLPEKYSAGRCLFGSHLVGGLSGGAEPCVKAGIAIVESEKTAVICSEVFPQYVWLATGGMSNLTVAMLAPLRGEKVILFPDTDIDGSTYRRWKEVAVEAGKVLGMGIMVSSYLERRASAAQKAGKIDLADLLLSNDNLNDNVNLPLA